MVQKMMRGKGGGLLASMLALTLVTAACSGQDDAEHLDAEAAADTAEADDGSDEPAGAPDDGEASGDAQGEYDPKQLPDFFPDAIPLPDDYLVVGDSSGEYDEVGKVVSLNIAIGGTIDEARDLYVPVLESEFEDVVPPDDPSDTHQPWRFSGQGFEFGALYISENDGVMDRGRVDSTQLDVLLTLNMDEHAYEVD